jgi:hypothetical protein
MKSALTKSRNLGEEDNTESGAFQPVTARRPMNISSSENAANNLRRSARAKTKSQKGRVNKRKASFQRSDSQNEESMTQSLMEVENSATEGPEEYPLK